MQKIKPTKKSVLSSSKSRKKVVNLKSNRKKYILIITAIIFAVIGVIFLRNSFAQDTWNMVWSDEFDGTAVDTSKWNIYTSTLGYDQACYTNAQGASGNIEVKDSQLIIRTKAAPGSCGGTRNYTSGYLRTDATGSSPDKYTISPSQSSTGLVRIEMRAQMPPTVKGIWPGLWSRNNYDGSTASNPYGELDLIERWGDEPNNQTYQVTTHNTTSKHTGGDTGYIENRKCPIPVGDTTLLNNCDDLTSSMHIYAVEIDQKAAEIRYYIDGRLVARHTSASSPGFDPTMWINSINGKWDMRIMTQVVAANDQWNSPPDANFTQAELRVDYVRVYTQSTSTTGTTTTTGTTGTTTTTGTTGTTTTTSPTTLATPTNVRAVPSDKTITLSWDPVAGANNYTVSWAAGSTTVYSNDTGYTNPTTNSYTINNLTNGTTYSLQVAARDSTGTNVKSSYSAPITSTPFATTTTTTTTSPGTTSDSTPPTKPSGLTAAMRYDILKLASVFDLKWNASTDNVGVAKYEIWRDGVKMGESTSTSYVDSNRVKTKRFYTYSVIAKDAAGNASVQATITAKGTCTLTACSTSIR